MEVPSCLFKTALRVFLAPFDSAVAKVPGCFAGMISHIVPTKTDLVRTKTDLVVNFVLILQTKAIKTAR